MIDKIIF